MNVPPVFPLDASWEEEDKLVPSTSGEDRTVSLVVVGVADQGAEGSYSMKQLQLAELEQRELQLQQVSLEDPGRE